MSKCKCNKLNKVAFGMALGALTLVSMIIIMLSAHFGGYGKDMIAAIGVMYGMDMTTLMGMIVLAIVAFVKAFIGGYLIAFFYNHFDACCRCCCCKDKDTNCCDAKK